MPESLTPVRDALAAEMRAALAGVAPSLTTGQRLMAQAVGAGIVSMPESTAREMARGIVRLAAQLDRVLQNAGG